MTYSPGPWTLGPVDLPNAIYGHATTTISDANGTRVTTLRSNGPVHEANARLITAAPLLLDALKDLAPDVPPDNAACHLGICSQAECRHCQRVIAAHRAIRAAEL